MNPEVVKPLLSSWRYVVPVFSVSAKTSYKLTVNRITDRTFPPYLHYKFRTTYLVFDHTHIYLLMQLLKLQCRRGTSLMLPFRYKSSVDAFEIGVFVVKRIKNNYAIL